MTQTRSSNPARWRRHALAWAATLALSPAAQAVDIFTGNVPVFVGSWFNGSFTEVVEFQYALDWAGWCNARAGATCSNHRYWNVAGNWDNATVPGPASSARVLAGDTVRIGSFISIYQGILSGRADVGTLSADGRVELYGFLRVGNATFADLHINSGNNSTLETTGLSTISLLSSGAGIFQGVGGTTRVQAFTPSPARGLFEPRVKGGHTLEFSGASLSAGLAVSLEPGARFVNSGTLAMAGGSIGLQGTATFTQLPTVVNQGTLQGSGTISGVRFDNSGQVQVGSGQAMAMGNWGVHSGHFIGHQGSTMSFAGIGSAGHTFAAGSQVDSRGAVNFGSGNHRVQGDFSAASASLHTTATLTFEGARPQIGIFHLSGGGTVALRTADGAAIGELAIDSNFSRFDVASVAPLDLQRLRLLFGSFNVQAPVTLSSSVEWSSGWFVGDQPVTSTANWRLLAGDRGFRGNVISSGNLSWEAGRFTEWSGHFINQTGAQFDIVGDFSSAGGAGGKLLNAGTVSKLAGAGRSNLAMGFDTVGGSVRALSGTLALTGGGTHTKATFAASPGAAIELAGGTTFGGQITVSGRLNLTGGDFTLLSGTAYSHAAGNRFDVANVNINPLAQLTVADAFRATGNVNINPLAQLTVAGAFSATGNVNNLGSFTPASHVNIGGDFNQQGSFALNPGKNLFVDGTFASPRPLTVSNATLSVRVLVNDSTLRVEGNSSFDVGTLSNTGTLVLGPATGFPGVSASIGGGFNSGTLRVDGPQVSVRAYDLWNTGLIVNEGSWYGSFTQHAGGRFDNAGSLTLNGTTTLFNTALVANSGTLTLEDGVLGIHVGAQVSGSGRFVQQAGLTHVNGLLQATGGIDILGGVLKGTGRVDGQVLVGPDALWRPGNSPGTMTLLGSATLQGGLEIDVASSAVHDRLVVSGSFFADYASLIDVVFDPGYRPQGLDIDRISWLSAAGGATIWGGARFTGLPTNWSATLAPDGQINLSYDLAQQIATRGSHAVAAGDVHFNALSREGGLYPLLDRLDNAGFFHNRAGASAYAVLLNNDAGATLLNRGELSARTLNNAGQLSNRSEGTLSVGSLNNSGVLVNQGNLDITNDFVNEAGAVLEQRGTMRVGDRVLNRGQMVVAGPLTGMLGFNNIGDLQIESGGSVEGRAGGWFWHSAGNLRVDGLLAADDIRVFGGTLGGNGLLRGNLTANGPVGPGNSVGLLTVDGNLTANGTVDLEIASAIDFDRLVVTGDATLAGGTSMYLLGSYRPVLGDSFSFLSIGGTLQVSNPANWVVLRLVDPLDASSGWTLWADASGIYDASVPSIWRAGFSQGSLSITAVPEPDTWALWASGLSLVAWLARRRRQSGADRMAASRPL